MLNLKVLSISLLAAGVSVAHAEIQCSVSQLQPQLRTLSEAQAKLESINKSDFPGYPRQIEDAIDFLDADSELADLLYGGYHTEKGYLVFEDTAWGKLTGNGRLKAITIHTDSLRTKYTQLKNDAGQGTYTLAPIIENTHLVDRLLSAQNCDQLLATLASYKQVQMAAADGLIGMGSLNQSYDGSSSPTDKNSIGEICATSGHELLASKLLGYIEPGQTSDKDAEILLRKNSKFLGSLKYFTAWDVLQFITGVTDDFLRDPANKQVQDAAGELSQLTPPSAERIADDRAVIAAACPAMQAKEQTLVKATTAADAGIAAAVSKMSGI